MEDLIKEMVANDHITMDNQYNEGLKILRREGLTPCNYTNPDVLYYMYCNGIGYWRYRLWIA